MFEEVNGVQFVNSPFFKMKIPYRVHKRRPASGPHPDSEESNKKLPSCISQPINQRKHQMWRLASRQSGRPLLLLVIPSYVKHSYAMTRKFYNSNRDSPYANGFPVLAEGLESMMPRTYVSNLILVGYMFGFEPSRRSLSCGVGESE